MALFRGCLVSRSHIPPFQLAHRITGTVGTALIALRTVSRAQSKTQQSQRATTKLWKGCAISGLAVGLSLSLLVGKAEAATFIFTKIADTNTPIPGGTGNFRSFGTPSLNEGQVAFAGSNSNQGGVYTNVGGLLNVVADTKTAIPGGTGNFSSLGTPSLNNGKVAFVGRNSNVSGIYTNVGGSLQVVADSNTAVPGGPGNFGFFDNNPVLNNGKVAFESFNSDQDGIYIGNGRQLQVVADRSTAIPGGTGKFNFFENPSLNNDKVAFSGNGSGIYISDGRQLNIVVDDNTAIPRGTRKFAIFQNLWLNKGKVAFLNATSKSDGVYISDGRQVNVVADRNTAIPGGTGNFLSFGYTVSLDNGNVVFLGSGSSQSGIYTTLEGSLTKVVAVKDSLNSKIISSLSLSREALSRNQIAFLASFTDGSSGIYVATDTSTTVSGHLLH